MIKRIAVASFLILVLAADLFSMSMVLNGWRKFNSDPALTLLMQILLACVLIVYLIQIASRKSI